MAVPKIPTEYVGEAVWTSGPVDRSGPAAYVHLVRSPDDPQRISRAARKDLGKGPVSWCGDMKASAKPEWLERIPELLGDGKPRTFNAIVLEVSGGVYTADAAFGKAPDNALWELVTAGRVEHTLVAPVLFRLAEVADG